jgi:hypothetical protein
MAATDNLLLHIDVVVIDGEPLAFEDGTGIITGAARFENTVVVTASGDDFESRKRVPCLFKCKMQFGAKIDPSKFVAQQGIQITARDQQSGRRALMPKCSFGAMGDLGGGSVDITYNVLAAIQWL